jgi:nicotinamide-nucleotide amidase
MKAEIISIGSELTSGQNLDTNAQWLSRQLAEIGIAVGWHTTVADDLEDNVAALRIAAGRARLILVTGGLGPTQDDLTREACARAAGVELVLCEDVLEHIRALFASRRREMPERNRVQALFPAGAKPIANAIGTAPGIWMQLGDAIVAAMPGVPSEMHLMFEHEIKPRLLGMGLGGGVLVQRKINVFGAGESAIEEKVADLTRRGHVPEVGITVSDATISLRIIARAASRAEAEVQIAPVERTIHERLGNLVFGVEDEELQHVVARLMSERRLTLATAESITAGLVAQRLAQVPGASQWLLGGVVSYDSRIKSEILGVPPALIAEHGAVSAPVVEAMAVGVRNRFRSDLGVSTVGLAGPSGEGDKPVGLVYVGLAWDGGVAHQSFNWAGTRLEIQSRTAKLALNRIRSHLLG